MGKKFNPIQYTLAPTHSTTEILVRVNRTSLAGTASRYEDLPNAFRSAVRVFPGLQSICPLFLDGLGQLPSPGTPAAPAPPLAPFTALIRAGILLYVPQLKLNYWKNGTIEPGQPAPLSETQRINCLTNFSLKFDSAENAETAHKELSSLPSVSSVEYAPLRFIIVPEARGLPAPPLGGRIVNGEQLEGVSPFNPGRESFDPGTITAGEVSQAAAGITGQSLSTLRTRDDRIVDAIDRLGKQLADCECCEPKKPDVPDDAYIPWPFTAMETEFNPNRGKGVTVAMFDLGVEEKHPDLKDRVHFGLTAAGVLSSSVVHGHHGTAVAGVMIGAKTGLLPMGEVVSYQVAKDQPFTHTGKNGKTISYYPVDMVLYASALFSLGAHNQDVLAVNISLGGTAPLCAAEMIGLHELLMAGIQPIAGSGNHFRDEDDPRVLYPARHPMVMSIGAAGIEKSTQFYKLASFSNHDQDGFLVNLLAPGVGIYSSMITSRNLKDHRGWFNGTSLATPWVSALYSLARKRNRKFEMGKVSQKLKHQKQAQDFDEGHGYGLVKFSKTEQQDGSTDALLRIPPEAVRTATE